MFPLGEYLLFGGSYCLFGLWFSPLLNVWESLCLDSQGLREQSILLVRLNYSGQGVGLIMEREGDFGRHPNLPYILSFMTV